MTYAVIILMAAVTVYCVGRLTWQYIQSDRRERRQIIALRVIPTVLYYATVGIAVFLAGVTSLLLVIMVCLAAIVITERVRRYNLRELRLRGDVDIPPDRAVVPRDRILVRVHHHSAATDGLRIMFTFQPGDVYQAAPRVRKEDYWLTEGQTVRLKAARAPLVLGEKLWEVQNRRGRPHSKEILEHLI